MGKQGPNRPDMKQLLLVLIPCFLLVGCSATMPPAQSKGHLTGKSEQIRQGNVPLPVSQAPFVPTPKPEVKQEVYTVVVNEVPVKELLFALARDAKMNVDIHPGISGKVTLNAIKQTLFQILNRISEQVPIRYLVDNENLVISPDSPFLRSYKINYVNMTRNSNSSVSVATEVATTGQGASGEASVGNVSKSAVKSSSDNDFWDTLIKNVSKIIGEDAEDNDKNISNRIISNPLSGILTVKATQQQHRELQSFLDQVMANAQRQVLIEATIVEVELSDRYQAGVDWQGIASRGATTLSSASSMTGNNLSTAPNFLLSLVKRTADFDLSMGVNMLETFGDVQVLSSPKIIAINNQTALLKVVDEKVYFEVNVEVEEDAETKQLTSKVSSKIRTVPVGMTMSVTPQINKNGTVTMNIRPTITRITRYVRDPGPQLQQAIFNNASQNYENLVPEIQVREMESLLQVRDGQTVVLGGLMQNKQNKNESGIPFLSTLPWIGSLFKYQDEEFIKTELVIFLRPVVVRSGDINQELQEFRQYLPESSDDNDREKNFSQNVIKTWEQS